MTGGYNKWCPSCKQFADFNYIDCIAFEMTGGDINDYTEDQFCPLCGAKFPQVDEEFYFSNSGETLD
jgi:hypothetical protein